MRNLELLGGTNSVEMIQVTAGPLTFENVVFQYYTHAGIYLDGWSGLQGLNTTRCKWQAGSNTANGVMEDALPVPSSGANGFLVTWNSMHDFWGGGLHAIIADSDGNSGGWTIIDPRFQDLYGTPVVLEGTITTVSFRNFSMEATGAGDNGGNFSNPMWNDTTGSTTAANSTSINVATTLRINVGDTIHISGAGGTAGTYSAGIDYDTTVVSCTPNACGTAGANTINISGTIVPIVTNVAVNNHQSNGFEILHSPVNTNRGPAQISFYDSQGCYSNLSIGDAGSCRYTIFSPNQAIFGVFNVFQGAPIYDPYAYANPVLQSYPSTGPVTVPWNVQLSLVEPGLRAFDGNRNYPTVYSGNPGQGELHWACGNDPGQCAQTTTFGSAIWMRNAANHRPIFQINYDTGLVSVGSGFNCCTGVTANFGLGTGNPQGANNSLVFTDGTAPSTHAGGMGQLVQLSGVLTHYDPSGVAHNLDTPSLIPTKKVVCKLDLVNQSAALNNVALPCGAASVAVMIQVVLWAKVTTPATTSSTLGVGGGIGGIEVRYVTGTDGIAQNVYMTCTTENGVTGIGGNTGNATTSLEQCSANLWLQANATLVGIYCGYTSAGATPMTYELHAREFVLDNVPSP
jgi:hypothetical protein